MNGIHRNFPSWKIIIAALVCIDLIFENSYQFQVKSVKSFQGYYQLQKAGRLLIARPFVCVRLSMSAVDETKITDDFDTSGHRWRFFCRKVIFLFK